GAGRLTQTPRLETHAPERNCVGICCFAHFAHSWQELSSIRSGIATDGSTLSWLQRHDLRSASARTRSSHRLNSPTLKRANILRTPRLRLQFADESHPLLQQQRERLVRALRYAWQREAPDTAEQGRQITEVVRRSKEVGGEDNARS